MFLNVRIQKARYGFARKSPTIFGATKGTKRANSKTNSVLCLLRCGTPMWLSIRSSSHQIFEIWCARMNLVSQNASWSCSGSIRFGRGCCFLACWQAYTYMHTHTRMNTWHNPFLDVTAIWCFRNSVIGVWWGKTLDAFSMILRYAWCSVYIYIHICKHIYIYLAVSSRWHHLSVWGDRKWGLFQLVHGKHLLLAWETMFWQG